MRRILGFLLLGGSLATLFPQCSDFSTGPATLPAAVVNLPYATQLTHRGGCAPYSAWQVQSGTNLPAGFQFDPATGKLTGTTATTGKFALCYKITAGGGSSSSGCHEIKVNPPVTLDPGPFLTDGFVAAYWAARIVKGGWDESEGSRPYSYKITSGALPPGVGFLPQYGYLEGTPAEVGDYAFTIQVTCSQGSIATRSYRVSMHPPGDFYTSTRKLVFTALTGSSAVTLPLGVATTDLTPVKFQLAASGSTGGAAPAWLKPGATSGETPAKIDIEADPKSLTAGKYTAKITVTPTGKTVQTVDVEFEIRDRVITLNSSPAFLEAEIDPKDEASLQRTARVLVWNEGDGDAAVTASVSSGTPWLTVTPSEFTVGAGQVQLLTANVDGSNLDYGAWHGSIDLKGPKWSSTIPIDIFRDRLLRKGRLHLSSSHLNHYMESTCGRTDDDFTKAEYEIKLSNVDEGPISFTAGLQGFGNAAELLTPSGSLPGLGSSVAIKVVIYPCRIVAATSGKDSHELGGLLNITATGASNSPYSHWLSIYAYDSSRLKTPAEALNVPSIKNEGILFVNSTDELKSMQSQMLINNPDVAPIPFTISAAPTSGSNYLSFDTPGGVAAPLSETAVTVKANPGAFERGEQFADGVVQMMSVFGASALWDIPTVMIVPDTQVTKDRRHQASTCAASRLVLVPGEPLPFFRYPVDWSAALNARVYDNCAKPVTDASVTASFSTNEPGVALKLSDAAKGLYQATWYPTTANEFVSVTLRAAKAGFTTVSRSLQGSVRANSGDPVVIHYAIVNNLNPVLGASVAPGTVAAIYGFNLATSTEQAQAVPLPRQLGGARVLIGGIEAPLFFASPGQINLQIPSELAVLDYHSVFVMVNGKYSKPKEIRLVGVNPGIAAYADGRVIAQHGDYSLINASSPAQPGEWIVLYLVGMGATEPAVASGERAPSDALASAKIKPKVTIGGAAAEIYFAGLTPGGVGLYQINCQVPAGAASGDLPLVVTQNGAPANFVQLPVQLPVKR